MTQLKLLSHYVFLAGMAWLETHCVDQAVLNSQRSVCFYLPSAGTKDIGHHSQKNTKQNKQKTHKVWITHNISHQNCFNIHFSIHFLCGGNAKVYNILTYSLRTRVGCVLSSNDCPILKVFGSLFVCLFAYLFTYLVFKARFLL